MHRSNYICTFADDKIRLTINIIKMAKGNLFQGMGRGKVGDVVFYRMNGEQISRVRNRKPKNPRTNEQLYQRAVIATTMKAYAAGKEIFDHSFQGYEIGEGNMRRFNSVNSRLLREKLVNDINNKISAEESTGRFVAPKSISPVPVIGLQVSEGTLENVMFTPKEQGGVYTWVLPDTLNFPALKIKTGDIFTFVYMIANRDEVVYENKISNKITAKQYNTTFGWIRLTVKEDRQASGDNGQWLYKDIFDIEYGGQLARLDPNGVLKTGAEVAITFPFVEYGGVMACIRSRKDIDVRSTAYMLPIHSTDFGLESNYVLNAWQEDVQKVGDSELILEGGDGGVDGPSVRPMPTAVSTLPMSDEVPVATAEKATIAKSKKDA